MRTAVRPREESVTRGERLRTTHLRTDDLAIDALHDANLAVGELEDRELSVAMTDRARGGAVQACDGDAGFRPGVVARVAVGRLH